MNTNELYLKTIFCCSACDEEIAPEEVALIKEASDNDDAFKDLDVDKLMNEYVNGINSNGGRFLKQYLKELGAQTLTDEEQIKLVDYSVQTILADSKIEYLEVKFFKKIRARLTLTDEQILAKFPDIEDWLLPDIMVMEEPEWNDVKFENINIS